MGFCTAFIRRAALPSLLMALAACEPSAPTAFDPDAAASDAAALEAAFDAPLMRSLAFAGAGIDRAMGGVDPQAVEGVGGSTVSDRLFEAMSRGLRPSFSSGELPAGVVGRTYVFDAGAGAYVVSESAGAPPSGARFQLYAVDPATGSPLEPLVTLGHVDVIGEGSSAVRILVADDGAVRLDYRVTATGSEAETRIQVEGFTSMGEARADFGFDNRIELTGDAAGVMRLGEMLSLPARDVALDCASVVLVRASLPPELQLEVSLRGPNGEVGIAGAYELGGNGALAVAVNGESYASVDVAGSDFTIAGTSGEPLPASAMDMLGRVVTAREAGLELFDRLVRPVETLIAP